MIYILTVHLKFSRTLILLWSKAFCRSINILIHTVFIQYSWLYDNMINILTVNSSNYTNKSTYIKSVLFLLILFQREAAKRPTPPPRAEWPLERSNAGKKVPKKVVFSLLARPALYPPPPLNGPAIRKK